MQCPSCKVTMIPDQPVRHAAGCKIAAEKRMARDLEETVDRILEDPEEYRTFLTRSMASHMVRLHQLAMQGSHRAAEQFRHGALDVLELLDGDKEAAKRTSAASSVAGKRPSGRRRKPARGKGQAVGEVEPASVELADGQGHGRPTADLDKGRER